MSDTVLILRTCDSDLRSWGGFQWPEHGYIEAPDWDPEPCCGKGLHGLLWGEGRGGLLDWGKKAKWLVVEALASDVVDLDGKVKFKAGEVIYAGSFKGALAVLDSRPEARKAAVVGAQRLTGTHGTAITGYRGLAVAENYGVAVAGNCGTATAVYRGTATAGDCGTATAGHCGTATAGHHGTAKAGYNGILVISYWEDRRRTAVGYVGEGGIEPDRAYRLNDDGKFVET